MARASPNWQPFSKGKEHTLNQLLQLRIERNNHGYDIMPLLASTTKLHDVVESGTKAKEN